MGTKLERIADKSAHEVRPVFTSLYHLLNEELLLQCHKELDGKKAVGIDEVTKEEYNANLKSNIRNLVERLKNKAYKPKPALRVYIPKANGKKRPLGLSSYEDKIVQLGLKKILEAVYEPKFTEKMYGFRPRRSCHMAIKEMCVSIVRKRINYIVDADIKGFLVVYADDYLAGFEQKWEAEQYFKEMQIRLHKYGLEIETSKSRLLEFGRYAKERGKRRGEGKPETFDFLGFTFYCGENQAGKFCVIPRTNGKRFRTKLKEMKNWLKSNRNTPVRELMATLNRKLKGHYHYYGLTYNIRMLCKYHYEETKLLYKWMNRRSQKRSYNWEGFKQMLEYYPLAYPKRYFNLYA